MGTKTEKRGAQEGFTLAELLIVIALMAILAAVSLPSLREWVSNARDRASARELFAELKGARSSAISRNIEHRVEVDLSRRRYARSVRLCKSGTSLPAAEGEPKEWCVPEESQWRTIPDGITLKSGEECTGDGDASGRVFFVFRPNGTAAFGSILKEKEFICMMEPQTPSVRRYRIGVSSDKTGRIEFR